MPHSCPKSLGDGLMGMYRHHPLLFQYICVYIWLPIYIYVQIPSYFSFPLSCLPFIPHLPSHPPSLPPSLPPPSVSCGTAGGSLSSTVTSPTSMKKTRQGNLDHASSETGITNSPNLGMITNVCIANCEVYILEFDGSNKPILT